MTRRLLLLPVLAGSLLLGFGGRQLTRRVAAHRAEIPTAAVVPHPAAAPAAASPALPHARSTEPLESLLAITDWTLYARLALWSLDASEADLATFWKSYRQRKPQDPAILELVFIQWTRLNPQAAIAADEAVAWRAWAGHDPAGALAAAIAAKPSRVALVAQGIGEFQPAWLRAHLDEIPAEFRSNALTAMKQAGDDSAPLETLEFLRQHRTFLDPGLPIAVTALARKDPWAAYDWVVENATSGTYASNDARAKLASTLAEFHPDVLERLAKQTPSGMLKRQLEAAVFDRLLQADPAAALADAKAAKAPRIAAERLAAVGNALLRSDPGQAFAIATELFTACPGALAQRDRTYYAAGASAASPVSIPGLDELLDGLMNQDPARTMGLHALFGKKPGALVDDSGFDKLADKWAERDLPAFTDWVDAQTDPAVRDGGGAVLIEKLTNQEEYAAAAGWAEQMQDSRVLHLYGVISDWQRSDPAAASSWLDAADLSEQQKSHLRTAIRNQP
jgi:hypothetical protein